MKPEISRASMSNEERDIRSRMNSAIAGSGLIHGHLSRRFQLCGSESCRCTRGERHETFVLVVRSDGRRVQVPVPKRLVPSVRRWIDQEKSVQGLLTRLSELQIERLRELKRVKPGG